MKFCFYLLTFCIYALHFSCVNTFDSKPANENLPPNTTMANIPVENDTVYALATLTWDGEDNDGYVVAFEYSYTTYPLVNSLGDSIFHDWQTTEKSELTIAFSSPDPLNRQNFQVRAVDNSGNVDPTPAKKIIYTTQTTPPTTAISSPKKGEKFFAAEQTSFWFPGITLKFSGDDRDGTITAYAWAADSGDWHWVSVVETEVIVKPQDFDEPLDGEHTLRVISKDDTDLIDPKGASVTIDLVVPSFEKDILILDETREDFSLRNVPDATVDDFYQDIFGYNNDYIIDNRSLLIFSFPDLRRLGKYKLVIWHSDDSKTPFYTRNSTAMSRIKSYLRIGGDLIMGGSGMVDPWLPPALPIIGRPHPFEFVPGSFAVEFLHLIKGDLSSLEGNFSGATGVGGFSDVEIDPTKMNPSFPHNAKVPLVVVAYEKGGFTRDILIYKDQDPNATGYPCAIRYYGDVYDLAFIGFPLWALKHEDARVFASELLKNMGY